MAFVEAGNEMIAGLMAGLDAFGEIIMAESLEQCPIETGTLRRSARVGSLGNRNVRGSGGRFLAASSYSGNGEVIIGYGFGDEINPKTHRPASEYAVPVHERVEAYHRPPTKAKFLEDPVMEHAAMMEPFLEAWVNVEPGLTPVLAAFIAGDSEMMGEGAGVGTGDLDAGDHPKGTVHE